MQSVSSRIWTRVAVSISYDDNDYTTGTGEKIGRYLNLARELKSLEHESEADTKLESVLENGAPEIHQDFDIQTDPSIQVCRPELV